MKEGQRSITHDIKWNTLGGYLHFMEEKGVSTNIASFVGNGTVREYVMGYENRIPTKEELTQMESFVLKAIKEGFFADIAIFDATSIKDNATFKEPHQYATGMVHVLVNGVPVLSNG